MEVGDYGAPEWGDARRTPGPRGYTAFFPAPLPRSLALDSAVVLALSRADIALGRLAGAGRLLPEPQLLTVPYATREALASSRIEGTQASLTDVFEASVTGASNADTEEVINYIAALARGRELLSTLPIGVRMLRQCHAVLLSGVRGETKTPGELRTTQNWIGRGGRSSLEDALFVPPPVAALQDGLADWERFVNEPPELPILVRAALMHYQFETLHPFLDGNGRLGRLLIALLLEQEKVLPEPLLYVSAALERDRDTYYSCLQGLRERGDVQRWLLFFLTAVAGEAQDAIERAERLLDLREDYRDRLRGRRSRAIEIIDLLMANPLTTTTAVQRRLGVTTQGAAHLLSQLVEAEIVTVSEGRQGQPRRYRAGQLLEALEVG